MLATSTLGGGELLFPINTTGVLGLKALGSQLYSWLGQLFLLVRFKRSCDVIPEPVSPLFSVGDRSVESPTEL